MAQILSRRLQCPIYVPRVYSISNCPSAHPHCTIPLYCISDTKLDRLYIYTCTCGCTNRLTQLKINLKSSCIMQMANIIYLSTGLILSQDTHLMRLLLYAFFWVIPRRLNLTCRLFGTLCLFHLHRQISMKYD